MSSKLKVGSEVVITKDTEFYISLSGNVNKLKPNDVGIVINTLVDNKAAVINMISGDCEGKIVVIKNVDVDDGVDCDAISSRITKTITHSFDSDSIYNPQDIMRIINTELKKVFMAV